MKDKSKRIMYLGNFGGKKEVETSQVKKTVSICNYLLKKGYVVYKVNSELLKSPLFLFILIKIIYVWIRTDVAIVSLNQNGLRFGHYFFLNILTKLKFRKKLFFITIGGWLPDFIIDNPKTINYFNKFDRIYVQTQKIQDLLIDIGINNTLVMWNFRDYDFDILNKHIQKVLLNKHNNTNPIRLVFFAIIKKEKGLSIAIDAINKVNKKYKMKIYDLDIIGPVASNDYITEFNNLIENNKEVCNYKGVISEQNCIYETLSKYDSMIFPTYYKGEGFPTVIVEAFISGLPVIASDWKYNSEIVKDRVNGLIFSLDKCDLAEKLEWLQHNRNILRDMKLNCLQEAKKYHTDTILRNLVNDIENI